MKLSRFAACVLVVFTALAPFRSALADAGGSDDPNDSAGPLDISRVSHTNNDDTATYRVETYEAFDIDDVFLMNWEFDFNGDGQPFDACALMKRIGSTNILRVSFFGECGPETWATADAKLGDRSIEFTLPLIDLVEGGGLEPDKAYSYRVTAQDKDGVEDTAPERELVVHEGVPVPTARPASAETQLSYPGDGESSGADGNRARSAEQARDEGPREIGDQTGDQAQSAGSEPEFRFGPIPVCSGSFCFALGIGGPVIAALAFVLVQRSVRRRRNPATANGVTSTRVQAEPPRSGSSSHPSDRR